jgi:hypothetical protein
MELESYVMCVMSYVTAVAMAVVARRCWVQLSPAAADEKKE